MITRGKIPRFKDYVWRGQEQYFVCGYPGLKS